MSWLIKFVEAKITGYVENDTILILNMLKFSPVLLQIQELNKKTRLKICIYKVNWN